MSRFILITSDPEFDRRVREAVASSVTGTFRTVSQVDLPNTPHNLLIGGVAHEQTQVVLFGPGVVVEEAFRLAAVFDIQRPEISLILVAEPEASLALPAMRAGIQDILSPDASAETLRATLERACRSAGELRTHEHPVAVLAEGTEEETGRVIVIASSKGGVGKTTVATNIAVVLGRLAPMSTVLVDLDSQFGDVASALQLEPEHTLIDAVMGAAKEDSMVLKAFLSVHQSSFYALCAPKSPGEADLVLADDVARLVEQLAREFRYVVIDTAPGLAEHALAALEKATDAILICTTDVPSVRGLRKEIDVLNKLGLAPTRRQVIVNLAETNTGLSIRDIEATLRTSVDVVIPRSKDVAFSTNRGIPLLDGKTRGPAARALTRIANHYDPTLPVKARRGIHKRSELK